MSLRDVNACFFKVMVFSCFETFLCFYCFLVLHTRLLPTFDKCFDI